MSHWRLLPLLVLTLACHGPVEARTPSAPSQLDSKVTVGGLSLHVVCRGAGRPPIVLEAGLGNDASVWSAVLPELSRNNQVCAYDRAGMGSSGAASRPHSNQQMAQELHDLLRAISLPEPYVLVGHSMGGANIRYLATKAPAAVAGMVLLDSVSEQQPSRYWSLMPPTLQAEFKNGIASLPEGLDFDTFKDGLEGLHAVSPSLGKMPLVVLSHGKPLPVPPGITAEQGAQMEAVWTSMQADLTHLSTNSAHVVVQDAGHHIQLDRPDAVVAAVRELLAAVRLQRPLDEGAVRAEIARSAGER